MKFPERFFRKIFKNTLDDHELDVEFRCLHPLRSKDGLWPKEFWVRSLEEMEKFWPEIADLNNRGYEVQFTAVPRLRTFQGKKEHPLPARVIVRAFGRTWMWAKENLTRGSLRHCVGSRLSIHFQTSLFCPAPAYTSTIF